MSGLDRECRVTYLGRTRSFRLAQSVREPLGRRPRWQLCFRAVIGIDEVERRVIGHRRRVEVELSVTAGLDLEVDEQLDFWGVRPRPPLRRPKSFFARKPLTRLEVAFGKVVADDEPGRHPKTREGCLGKDEPCPHARCRYHLAIDINAIGSIRVNFPGWSIEDLEETCSLNVADRGEQMVETVARLTNLSTERIRQIEIEARRKIARVIDPDKLLRVVRAGPRRAAG